jgi:cytochrome P450
MDPEMAANPQALYPLMRECPVMPVEGLAGVGVLLSTKEVIDEALRHPEIYSSNMDAVDLKNKRPMIPLQIDPPDQKKYRKLLDPLFSPRKMAAMEEEVAALVNDLIDRFIENGQVDFASQFSVPFPSQVFLTLLGLPLDEVDTFLAMKDGIIRPDHVTGALWGSDQAKDYQQKTADSVYEYFDKVLDEREIERRDDLLSHFLDAEMEGNRLNREEILDICFLFLIAGLDTVTATLDCMFSFLAQHPEHRQQIVDDPSIIPSAIEEMMRWETPVMGVARVAVTDTELGGCPIKQGDQVMIMLGSANTDEAEFPDGHLVRFDREVNRHVAFGGGIHRCLGSHLARMELRVALREWHRRIPEYEVEPGHTLVYTPAIRSIEHFPLRFTAV